MPKELIRGSLSSTPYGEEVGAESVVKVTWSREHGGIQLATMCVDRSTHDVYIPDWTKKILAEVAHQQHEPVAFNVAQEGWFIDLDRRGVNELIRVLRRARDQAFGRDE